MNQMVAESADESGSAEQGVIPSGITTHHLECARLCVL